MARYILEFKEIGIGSLPVVGGKNASLGEMFRKLENRGVRVPDGFATLASAYWAFLDAAGLRLKLAEALGTLDTKDFANLRDVGLACRRLILAARFPGEVEQDIREAYRSLLSRTAGDIGVAVRSSATAEDLPDASFAGQMESFLNVRGDQALLDACHRCFASLFTDRAIQYRALRGFRHMDTAVSVGVQAMVRSDLACSGVAFTLEPETGNSNVVVVTGSWGLGENVVQGLVTPDQYVLFKPSLRDGTPSVVSRTVGAKEFSLRYADSAVPGGETTRNHETSAADREVLTLSDREAEELGRSALAIEEHYGRPMDIEWAKDGKTGKLYIVQARPETVHGGKHAAGGIRLYELQGRGKPLARGVGLGGKIASGRARVLRSPAESEGFREGDILVTASTTPDWNPLMKKAAAIVTDTGGRTSHAAIVARELGIAAVVGTGTATSTIADGQEVTVSCAEGGTGIIYEGRLPWKETSLDPERLPVPVTKPMLILADPSQAFRLAALPSRGVGLMRLEFAIADTIGIHPMALARFDELEEGPARQAIRKRIRNHAGPEQYFVDKLSEAVATVAAAFHPRDVVVRLSDFKTNEYARLLGGSGFEPKEENPMLGFRGASRYHHPKYRDGFRLECLALRKVRSGLGLRNVKVMVPFCRTPEEGRKVVEAMAEYGLKRGEDGLEVLAMVEIPSNVLRLAEFAEVFDAFSIGSNDLTQLTLGLDRDSEVIAPLFSERDPAVMELIARAIREARRAGAAIGLCGQAPSDDPDFARFLVEQGITSISFNPDALLKGIENIAAAEKGRVP